MTPAPLFSAPPAVVEAISTVGTALVFCLCAAQLPTFRLVAQRKLELDKVSFLPTLGQLANFSTWTVYGLAGAHNPTVVTVNVLGIAFCALYVALFLYFASPARRVLIVRQLAALGAAFAAIEAAVLLGVSDATLRASVLAYVSIACNVVMYGSPIVAIRSALAAMDPAAIPLLLTVASLACSVCWGLYGALIADYIITAPNVAGAALIIAQLATAAFISLRVARDPELTRRLARERRAARGAGSDDEDELLGDDDDGAAGARAADGVTLSVSS